MHNVLAVQQLLVYGDGGNVYTCRRWCDVLHAACVPHAVQLGCRAWPRKAAAACVAHDDHVGPSALTGKASLEHIQHELILRFMPFKGAYY
jgi:hypothetical protein